MVGITVLFFVTMAPSGIFFALTLFVTPTTTLNIDIAYPFIWLNALLQPIIYIMAFSELRKAFLQLFCLAEKETLNVNNVADTPWKTDNVHTQDEVQIDKLWGIPENCNIVALIQKIVFLVEFYAQ